jgi:hypothetical protein
MHNSITESYQLFPFRNRIGFSTFYEYIEDKHKLPNRLSDLCDYCVLYKDLKLKISSKIIELDPENIIDPTVYVPQIDTSKLISYYENHPNKNDENIRVCK